MTPEQNELHGVLARALTYLDTHGYPTVPPPMPTLLRDRTTHEGTAADVCSV